LNKNSDLLQQESIKNCNWNYRSKAEKAGFKVTKMLSGPMGGDAQIAARVAEGKTKMVLFFKDPLAMLMK
jgi:methylglyoxal synthase